MRRIVGIKCVVCDERPVGGSKVSLGRRVGLFCNRCGRSWDRDAEQDCTMAAAVVWAAVRARRFERRRHTAKGGSTR